MANTKSAKKAIRKTKRKTKRNVLLKSNLKKSIKEVRKLANSGDIKAAAEKYKSATKKLDKAAKTDLIHKNTANRYKSRLAKLINKSQPKKKS